MEHGISLLPDCRPHERSAGEYYRDAIAIAEFSERAGLDYVKMTEHYLGDYGGYCPSPLTYLAAVAARTERIRLMTGALLPAFHHPIQLAAHIAQVDAISGGRVDAGFGRAWLPYEFEAFQVPLDESRLRYEATIKAVTDLWTQSSSSADTPYFSYRDATSLPPVTQRPHPPVWGAAVKSPESFTYLATQGFGVMLALPPARQLVSISRHLVDHYRDVFQTTHGPSATPRVAMSTPLYVARTDREAYAQAEPLYRKYLTVWTEAAQSWQSTSSQAYNGYEALGRNMEQLISLDIKRSGTAVIGSPQAVAEQIQELHETYGADVYLWNVDFGGQTYEQMQSSLKLFTEEVIPRL